MNSYCNNFLPTSVRLLNEIKEGKVLGGGGEGGWGNTMGCTKLILIPLCYVNVYHENFLFGIISLHCIALHCIALHCIALHCIALHCIALHCIALHCIALHCIPSPFPQDALHICGYATQEEGC